MHRLVRQVRFSVDPFDGEVRPGSNPYASRPTSLGLALFLELGVQVRGPASPLSGFVVDVGQIDRAVRRYVVPLFVDRIRDRYCRYATVGIDDLVQLLWISSEALKDKLGDARLERLRLKWSPFRGVEIRMEDPDMVYYSEKFEFAAMHKLWNLALSETQNLALFGKCANPTGHGHNYVVEITVKARSDRALDPLGIERIVDEQVIERVDHKNLNADVPYFAEVNPTMENIAKFAWQGLAGRLGQGDLVSVTIWESDRVCCSYDGQEEPQEGDRA